MKHGLEQGRPFLDYYGAHGISPVSQNIADKDTHLHRRNALYKLLGIAPGLVAGKSVLEFGPGSGHNALHTLTLRPSRFLLVDGNETGLREAKSLLRAEKADETDLEFILTDFSRFTTQERFDIVLCEGFLSYQFDPCAMLRHLAGFVKKGGILVCTCVDPISNLPDMIRRIVGQAVFDRSMPLESQVAALTPLFESHLASLEHMSRPVRDWLLDVILHPLSGKLLPMGDAIKCLDASFDFYGSSPHFVADWRWYKDIKGARTGTNALGITAWKRNAHNLLNHRCLFPERAEEENARLYALADRFMEDCFVFCRDLDYALLVRMADTVDAVAENLAPLGDAASSSRRMLRDGAGALRQVGNGSRSPDFGTFTTMFGRAQQYLSFIRVE